MTGPGVLVSDGSTYDGAAGAQVATHDDFALVAWTLSKRNEDSTYSRVVQAALMQGETVVKPTFTVDPDSDAAGLAVAFDGEQYWIAWTNRSPSGIHVVRVALSGDPIGQTVVVDSEGSVDALPALVVVQPSQVIVGTSKLDEALGSSRAKLRLLTVSN